MKRPLTLALGCALLVTLGCKSDSSSTGDTTTTLDSHGAAYFPITSNDVVSAHFNGSMKAYDVAGSLTDEENIDQDRTAFTDGTSTRDGLPFFNVFGYNDQGQRSGRPDVFITTSNDKVLGVGRRNDPGMVLPASLSVGLTWNPDPYGSPNYKATLVKHLESFTTKNGNTWQDVIQVDASAKDSSSSYDSFDEVTDMNSSRVTGTVYFAKGVGPIELLVTSGYSLYEQRDNSANVTQYSRTEYSGSVSRNK